MLLRPPGCSHAGLECGFTGKPFGIVAAAIGAVIGLIAQFGDEIDVSAMVGRICLM